MITISQLGCQTQRALEIYFKLSDLFVQTICQLTACGLALAEAVALPEGASQFLPGCFEIDDRRRLVDQLACMLAVSDLGEGMCLQQNHVCRLCSR